VQVVRSHTRGDVRVEEVPPPPPPGPGEVQLRVSWCGICGTDLEEWQDRPLFIPVDAPHPVMGARAPLVLGHEFAGVVRAAGEGVTEPVPGQRVPSTRSCTAAPAIGAGAAR
jgi:(R,R)-butanediol dehydrogenase / meso-butanediol dehydrogenase / diacetyl reductase